MAWSGAQQGDPPSPAFLAIAGCGAGSVHSTAVGGDLFSAAGTKTWAFKVPNDGVGRVYVNWLGQPVAPNLPSLVAGSWDMKLNITAGSSGVNIGGAWICHEGHGGETIAASFTSLGPATTGVHTITFANVAPTYWKPGDMLRYVMAFNQPFGFGTATIRVKYDQLNFYPLAENDWRGVTCGGGYADRLREAVL